MLKTHYIFARHHTKGIKTIDHQYHEIQLELNSNVTYLYAYRLIAIWVNRRAYRIGICKLRCDEWKRYGYGYLFWWADCCRSMYVGI